MSTPPTASTYRVTWLPGGDRPVPHTQEVQAVDVEIDASVGFAFLRDGSDTPVFAVNTAFLVSVERITEKG